AALVRQGFIGCSPLHPSVAISIRSLAVYRQSHRVCPRLSIQAEVRKLCHLHNVPYHRYLADQYSIAYDVYLEVLHRVHNRLEHALGHDEPDWRLKNACPACFYKLEDETPLKFSFLCQMDGNNSLKRTDANVIRKYPERLDSRGPRTDYWLSPEEVDKFKDEVKAKSGAEDDEDYDDDWEDLPETDPVSTCIDRWRNAGPEQRKKMFALFDESGIFLAACRHGTVLLICDMIRSGELAKYPLATVNKILDVHGSDIACGFDIGCAFEKTLAKSSLSPKVKDLRLRMVVGSFHGHAHNRGCQLGWHPLYVPGIGRADLEGCERVFSSSNALAPGTRHASKFHRHQAVEEHFAFWDADKYANLSTLLANHYREALKIVGERMEELSALKAGLGIDDDSEFEGFLRQERLYLSNLKKEPPEEALRFEYLEALDNAAKLRCANLLCLYTGFCLFASSMSLNEARGQLNRLQSIPAGDDMRAKLLDTIKTLERQLGIEQRWEESSSQYITAKAKVAERNYRKALDALERLVVQRLFELTKLNMSGTGASTALQRRSDTIKRALQHYNMQAAQLNPPRPTLTWKQIVDYTFIAEFDLLHLSREDIRDYRWAQPAVREATVKYLELQRAQEEIARLNVEIRRLRTAIHDEQSHVAETLGRLTRDDLPLATELMKRWHLRLAVNKIHSQRLDRVEAWSGFSG
ncbi:hypothetical protein GLOTRDRAFT_21641, partial [Gloeophyllum trabeum ATCC 11539]